MIRNAKLDFNEHGTPMSSEFSDVYYSNDGGATETSYVFIDGNRLLERWKNWDKSHFCIAETGFGTGLNFFCVAEAFLQFTQENPDHPLKYLHFLSTEKYPVTKEDMLKIYESWQGHSPAIKSLMKTWIDQYPELVAIAHRRKLHPQICLDVHYKDAVEAFCDIHRMNEGQINAWFLDGFAPSKNSSLWTPPLFELMAKLSNKDTTFATFTAAGAVKRGLQSAGFSVKKRKGFGKKRDMLVGVKESRPQENSSRSKDEKGSYESNIHQTSINISSHQSETKKFAYQHKNNKHQAPFYYRHATASKNQYPLDFAIVGNGIAGIICSYKLLQEGHKVSLYWQGRSPADGASGNAIGGFYPQLNAQQNNASRVQLASFLYAHNFYNELHKVAPFEHDFCGALQLAFNENTQGRLRKLAQKALWPSCIGSIVDSETASHIAGIDIPYAAYFMPMAGWISPPSLVKAIFELIKEKTNFHFYPQHILKSYNSLNQQSDNLPQSKSPSITLSFSVLNTDSVHEKKHHHLILATGSGTKNIVENTIPNTVDFRTTRGQVEIVRSSGTVSALKTLLCHKGYFSPSVNGYHALGSSYVKNDDDIKVRAEETINNFEMHKKSMQAASWVGEFDILSEQDDNFARAAIRCSSADHLPVVGAMPSARQQQELQDLYKALPVNSYPIPSVDQNVFLLSGLGSRGLTSAPLMAELLVSQILGRPLPLEADLLNSLNPNRFLVRRLIKSQKN